MVNCNLFLYFFLYFVCLSSVTRALDWLHKATARPRPASSSNCHIALLQSLQDYCHWKLLSSLIATSLYCFCSMRVLLDSKLLRTICFEAFPLRSKWTDCNILGLDHRLWNWTRLRCAMSSRESGQGCSKGQTRFCIGAPKSEVYVSRSTSHCRSSCIWRVVLAPL